jgi:hypothetical protein
MFIVSGFTFFISMMCAILLMANDKMRTVKIFGVILAALMVPIIAILINYIVIGKNPIFIIYLVLIFIYLLAEFLLDSVFKYDFRSKASTHVPYIVLEWAAAFSFVFGTLRLDSTIGWIISFLFWAFIAVLAYYIIKRRKKDKN